LLNDFNADALFEGLCAFLDEINSEKTEGEDSKAAWEQLLSTMTPDHALVLCTEFESAREARLSGKKYDLNRLAAAASWMIAIHIQNKRYGRVSAPLNLRPDIAEAFLHGSKSIRVCPDSDCNFRFPIKFKKCPLCFP